MAFALRSQRKRNEPNKFKAFRPHARCPSDWIMCSGCVRRDNSLTNNNSNDCIVGHSLKSTSFLCSFVGRLVRNRIHFDSFILLLDLSFERIRLRWFFMRLGLGSSGNAWYIEWKTGTEWLEIIDVYVKCSARIAAELSHWFVSVSRGRITKIPIA